MPNSGQSGSAKPISRPDAARTHIRRAEDDELYVVQSLAQKIWPNSYDGVIAPDKIDMMLAEIYSLEALEKDIYQLGHVYWIVSHTLKDATRFDAGYASAYKDGNTIWIKKLYIHPDYQGLGLGKALMHKALDHFGPARQLSLYVNKGNEKAIAYYKYNGMEIVDEVPVRMGPFDFIDYIMTKPL